MKKLLLLCLLALPAWPNACVLNNHGARGSAPFWTWGGWQSLGSGQYKAALTYNSTLTGSSATSNFPALVTLSGVSLKTTANGGYVNSSTGLDILFYSDSALSNQIASEVESYDGVNGILNAWVLIGALGHSTDHSADGIVYVTVGNASPPARTTNPWAAAYKGVWHLANGTTLSTNDSTTNATTATANTGTATAGQIGGGAAYLGTSSQYTAFNNQSLYYFANATFTVSAWFQTTASGVVTLVSVDGYTNGWELVVNSGAFQFITKNSANGIVRTSSSTNLNDGKWHYGVAVVTTNTTVLASNTATLYVDGVVNQGTLTQTTVYGAPSYPLNFGRRNTSGPNYLTGNLDEVHIYAGAVSADQITAEFNNQVQPGNLTAPGCNTAQCSLSAIAADTSGSNWTGASCTAMGYVPVSGDTVSIPDGAGLTVDQNWIVGSSPASNGTAAISLNNTGALSVASGATLRARGDIVFTPSSSNSADALTMAAGSTLIFDSSLSSSPATTRYRYGGSGGGVYSVRPFVANGTSASHVIVTSCTPGNDAYCVGGADNSALPGQFRGSTVGGTGCGGSACGFMRATYTDFSYIGDSTSNGQAFEIGFSIATTFALQHSTCNYCGPTLPWGATNLTAGSTLHVDYNVWTNSVGAGSNIMLPAATTMTSGARTVTYNVFDKRWNDGDGNCNGQVAMYNTTFTGNYFGGSKCNTGEPTTAANQSPYADNFFYVPSTISNSQVAIGGNLTGSYYLDDITSGDDPKPLYMEWPLWTANGNVFDVPDDPPTNIGHVVSSWNGATDYLQNNIVVPSKTGKGTMNLSTSTATCGSACSDISFYHNTVAGPNANGTGSGLLQINEGGSVTAPWPALESNIGWAPAGARYCQVDTATGSGALYTNAVTVADYNASDQYVIPTAVSSGCISICSTACPNQGNGYIGNWSATPGAHDVMGSPNFADPLRSAALWDTKYLGHAAGAAWQTGTSYAVGQIVSDSHAGYYGGATINFRCIAAHTSGSTTEPNAGANWRTDWEWASVADLRAAIASSTTYTDGAIGCSGCTAIQALVKWVRAGFTPQNPALWCAGHDGEAIGAVPFCAKGKVMIGILAGM